MTKTPKGSEESEKTESEKTETPIQETTQETTISESPGTSTSGATESEIVETPIETLPPVEGEGAETNISANHASPDAIKATVEDCQAMYGLVMETAHGMVMTKKGKGHRDLPEARRLSQGALLHRLSIKYNVTIPTELELVIFGGSIIADWRYMTTIEDTEQSIESIPVTGGNINETTQTDDNSDKE